MGLTYTRSRDLARTHARRATVGIGELVLLLTSAAVLMTIAVAYAGRAGAEAVRAADAPAPLNLNAQPTTNQLEAALSAAFPYPADRQFAAKAVAAYLRPPAGEATRELANVGALTRLEVPASAIEGNRTLVDLRARLDALKTAAVEAGRQPPVTIPLITPADLVALKPFVSVRSMLDFRSAVLWWALVVVLAFQGISLLWRWQGVAGDRIMLATVHLLVGVGFAVMLSRPDPIRDTLLLARFAEGVLIGVALFGMVSLINLDRPALRELTYLPLVGALTLSALLLIFGSGPGSSTARINLGPIQPIEAIRLLLALFLAGYFARRWELLRQVRAETMRSLRLPAWINLPRLTHVLPVAVGVGTALLLFFFQKDLGPALLLTLMFLAMFAIARGGAWLAGLGLAGLVAGFGLGYLLQISSTLGTRLQMWLSPWDNGVRGGDQVAHGVWGLASGAVAGTGLGLGQSRFIPEAHTDLVLAAVGEELGFIGLLVVATAFVLIVWRGFAIARRATSDYRFFLAMALTLSLAIPVLVMAAGILGVLPLTGVVTPFLSYGGSAMAANFAALGLLIAIGGEKDPSDLAAFQLPVRWLAGVMGAAAAGLLVVAANVQTVRADEYLVRPQRGLQADGGRRFQYNPRVLDALRSIPRGTIYDRNGLPLASNDTSVLAKSAPAYAQLGRKVREICPTPDDRCYPAGPSFFHVLGDSTARTNWSATNASYVEREAEDQLRGFDDRAVAVTSSDAAGHALLAMRRDFEPVVSLVRHRWEPDHPAVKAFRERSRDVRVTIDARLQLAVAGILERAAKTSGAGKGAVVVLDAATGEILASVSYPWPLVDREALTPAPAAATHGGTTDAALDRARYGLYPPGSTFKIITAAAALREDPRAPAREFLCQRFPNGRIGTRIPGFGPPIYDDVHDATAHGQLNLHDAVVKSCNAYFAQLAVALGSDPLARTAAEAGITLNTSRSPDRVRANLPHAGYGQGEVVATPLRMARVAAAIGTDGVIREAPIVTASPARTDTIDTAWITADAARALAIDLRDAVTQGTGRQLKDHPARIAGKTGTAEIDDAAPHAWFVGFAPSGQAPRRIAFAVVLEHAGYGGQAAAGVAGQVAAAAASLGFIK
jgi:cell division protein FtsW (lipid II flippase)